MDTYTNKMLLNICGELVAKGDTTCSTFFKLDFDDQRWIEKNYSEGLSSKLAAMPASPLKLKIDLNRAASMPAREIDIFSCTTVLALCAVLGSIVEEIRERGISARASWGLTEDELNWLASSTIEDRMNALQSNCIHFEARTQLSALEPVVNGNHTDRMAGVMRILSNKNTRRS